jgi:hypothetical protein
MVLMRIDVARFIYHICTCSKHTDALHSASYTALLSTARPTSQSTGHYAALQTRAVKRERNNALVSRYITPNVGKGDHSRQALALVSVHLDPEVT